MVNNLEEVEQTISPLDPQVSGAVYFADTLTHCRLLDSFRKLKSECVEKHLNALVFSCGISRETYLLYFRMWLEGALGCCEKDLKDHSKEDLNIDVSSVWVEPHSNYEERIFCGEYNDEFWDSFSVRIALKRQMQGAVLTLYDAILRKFTTSQFCRLLKTCAELYHLDPKDEVVIYEFEHISDVVEQLKDPVVSCYIQDRTSGASVKEFVRDLQAFYRKTKKENLI